MKVLKTFYKYLSNRNGNDLSKKMHFSIILLLFTIPLVFAQKGKSYGIKAGINYNANGDYFNTATMAYEDPTAAAGFHIGVFGKLGNKVYLKPELVYTKTKSEYTTGDFSLQKIDAPALVGIKIIGPLSAFAGPAFQYILDSDFDNASISDIESDFSIGLNFGVAVNFKRIGLDLRYERGFSNNEATIITDNSSLAVSRLDTRPSQLILSLSIGL